MVNNFKWYLRVLLCALDLDLEGLGRRGWALIPFYRQLQTFKKSCQWPIEVEPRLGDNSAQAGSLGEYFWQDLAVAKRVIDLAPKRHVDVGSRIDGFVGHLACLREMEVLDIRPLKEKIPGVSFHQVDIMNPPAMWFEAADCLTCLHSIEHFGLGRYGDSLDVDGWQAGLRNLARIVSPGGIFILSTPVGSQRVKFNSHRIFAPATIVDFAATIGLSITHFSYLTHDNLHESPFTESVNFEEDFAKLALVKYGLGIFEFRKPE